MTDETDKPAMPKLHDPQAAPESDTETFLTTETDERDAVRVTKAGFLVYGDVIPEESKEACAKALAKVKASAEYQQADAQIQRDLEFQATAKFKVRKVVAPWAEGRFERKGHKFYALPKGSIDEGENPLDAGLREATEETGLDMRKLLGETLIEKAKAGQKALEESGKHGIFILRRGKVKDEHGNDEMDRIAPLGEGSPDIKIEAFGVVPMADRVTIHKNGEQKLRTQLFAVKLADGEIDKLAGCLKNKERHTDGIRLKQEDTTYAHRYDIGIPNIKTMLEWMRAGEIPADLPVNTANNPEARTLTDEERAYPNVRGQSCGEWFAQLEQRTMATLLQRGIVKRKSKDYGDVAEQMNDAGNLANCRIRDFHEWYQFFKALPLEDKKCIEKMASQTKHAFATQGITKGDNDIYKLDSSDLPFCVYQEGAEILPITSFFERAYSLVDAYSDYSRAFITGEPVANPSSWNHLLSRSQLSMMAAVARLADIRALKTPEQITDNEYREIDTPKPRSEFLHEWDAFKKALEKDWRRFENERRMRGGDLTNIPIPGVYDGERGMVGGFVRNLGDTLQRAHAAITSTPPASSVERLQQKRDDTVGEGVPGGALG